MNTPRFKFVLAQLALPMLCGATGCSEIEVSTWYMVRVGNENCAPNWLYAAGDSYRFILHNSESGNVYLLRREPTGRYTVLFPDPAINGGASWVLPGATLVLPHEGAYRFPPENGSTDFVLIVTGIPAPPLAPLERARTMDADVVDDMIRAYEARPGTHKSSTWVAVDRRVEKSSTDLSDETTKTSDGGFESRLGHSASRFDWSNSKRLVVVSDSIDVGMIDRFTLRYEMR